MIDYYPLYLIDIKQCMWNNKATTAIELPHHACDHMCRIELGQRWQWILLNNDRRFCEEETRKTGLYLFNCRYSPGYIYYTFRTSKCI